MNKIDKIKEYPLHLLYIKISILFYSLLMFCHDDKMFRKAFNNARK